MDYSTYKGRGRNKISGAERPVTYLPNVAEWVSKVYCIECDNEIYSADDVLGGVNGVDNAQGQALANRTYFLKENVIRLMTVVSAMQLVLSPMLTTIKKFSIQPDAPTDWEHESWLQLEDSAETRQLYAQIEGKLPTIKLTLTNGQTITKPIFNIELDDGRTFYIRTDVSSVLVPKVEEYVYPQEEEE